MGCKKMNEIYTIECTNLPMMPDPRQVMYVEREYDWYMNQFVIRHTQKFKTVFSGLGYDFCYLPDMQQMLGMAFCVSQIVNSCFDFNPSLCKFSHMEKNRAVFYCMELNRDMEASLVKQFYEFVIQVKDAEEAWERHEAELYRMRVANESLMEVQELNSVEVVDAVEVIDSNEEASADAVRGIETGRGVDGGETQRASRQLTVEEELAELQARIDNLRKRGVAQERLQTLVEEKKPLSRLLITHDYRILLPDYGNAEVKLQPIHKAVFLLYLKHPDGIRFKELDNYSDELFQIYISLADRGSTNSIRKTISSVCAPTSNAISEKCSRIREAFLGQVPDESLAQQYFITGQRGEKKHINLDRALVTWE